MKIVYSSCWVGALLTLSTLTYMCALISSTLGHTFFSWDLQAQVTHMVQFKLLICVEECVCTDACTHMDYRDGRLSCDLVARSQAYRNLQLEGRIGEMKSEDHDVSLLTNVSKEIGEECTFLTPMCPDLVTEDDTLLLENLDTTGSQRLIQFTWPPGQDGWNTVSCEVVASCVNVDVQRKMPSTMRNVCKSDDSECLDKNSECRCGQCWCKPGLSHDSNSRSCVVMCLGQYGTTFQIVEHFLVRDNNSYVNAIVTDSLQECMNACVTYVQPTYTCKSMDIAKGTCSFNNISIPENQKPTMLYLGQGFTYMQRDCRSVID